TIPSLYRVFFLYAEHLNHLVAAYLTAFKPSGYLSNLSLVSSTAPTVITTTQTTIALVQLGNMYLFLGLSQYLVLSSAPSTTTWKRLLLAVLVADFGHLASMRPLGMQVYWNVWEWNILTAGSTMLVYLCALMRICFILNVGM
ncbi:hypothetical protein CYLTODRAFT_317624, partial [Cylindrobasidium torrendii FP15055 ss-10]